VREVCVELLYNRRVRAIAQVVIIVVACLFVSLIVQGVAL
jgi:hypothetical protein